MTCKGESKTQVVVELIIMSFKKERDSVLERSGVIAMDKKELGRFKAWGTS